MSRNHTAQVNRLQHNTHDQSTSAKRQVSATRVSDCHMPLEPRKYKVHATILRLIAAEVSEAVEDR